MAARNEASEAVRAFAEHEHLDLARGFDRVHDAACSVGTVPTSETIRRIRDVVLWFAHDLQPHLTWEEAWLYPQIEAITGTAWSTRAARFDHGQVRTIVERLRRDELHALEHATPAVLADIRCTLFSLEAMVRAHVEREEQLLLPALAEAADARLTDRTRETPSLAVR